MQNTRTRSKGFKLQEPNKCLSKEAALENIEMIVGELFEIIQLSYGKQLEPFVAKGLIRAKRKKIK